jgi:uridine kinase
MIDLDPLHRSILRRRREIPGSRALLVGISGIDGSGKGFIAKRLANSLGKVVGAEDDRARLEISPPGRQTGLDRSGYNVALIGVDGWLNLPDLRFSRENCAERFYQHALRLDEMFKSLVVPLRNRREVELEMDFTEETATAHRKHCYRFREVDIILLEGIFLFKRQYRAYFDLTSWIECSFETALARAVRRCQERLPPRETVAAFQTIYFPAQRIHFERDAPQVQADFVLFNDSDELQHHWSGSAGEASHPHLPKMLAENGISGGDSPSQAKSL